MRLLIFKPVPATRRRRRLDLQSAPCAFLEEETNACKIYSERPQACREFPHTDRKNMREIFGHHRAERTPVPDRFFGVQSILDEVKADK